MRRPLSSGASSMSWSDAAWDEPDHDVYDEYDEGALWAGSGAMALTGRADGPPLMATGRPASAVARALQAFDLATSGRWGSTAELPDVRLLGERGSIAGLRRRGPDSCGGAFRILPSLDGHLGLTLARREDLELVPALVEASADEPWSAVRMWAQRTTTDAAVARCRLLGLPAARVPATPEAARCAAGRSPVRSSAGGARRRPERPRVIDLSSLWAGPLCAHLLGLRGAEVIKVESLARPDGARRGPSRFFDLLHHGHLSVTIDHRSPSQVEALRDLIASADLVLDSSRASALVGWGIVAEEVVEQGVHWLSITARGRASRAVGFGDDVAVGAGLVAWDGRQPVPAGDAIADPLAGVTAARAAAAALNSDRAHLIDVSMHDVAAAAARTRVAEHLVRRTSDGWIVETESGCHRVAAPTGRTSRGPAALLGADTDRWLG